jgi:hypothetical protein
MSIAKKRRGLNKKPQGRASRNASNKTAAAGKRAAEKERMRLVMLKVEESAPKDWSDADRHTDLLDVEDGESADEAASSSTKVIAQ